MLEILLQTAIERSHCTSREGMYENLFNSCLIFCSHLYRVFQGKARGQFLSFLCKMYILFEREQKSLSFSSSNLWKLLCKLEISGVFSCYFHNRKSITLCEEPTLLFQIISHEMLVTQPALHPSSSCSSQVWLLYVVGTVEYLLKLG